MFDTLLGFQIDFLQIPNLKSLCTCSPSAKTNPKFFRSDFAITILRVDRIPLRSNIVILLGNLGGNRYFMITFLSLTSYPTKKAYGVTTKYTMEALEESGITTEIISADNLRAKKILGQFTASLISSVRLLFHPGFSLIGKYAFSVNRFLYNFYLTIELEKSGNYRFWTRDIRLAGFLQDHFSNSRVVLEIHQYPNDSEKEILKWLRDRSWSALSAKQF